MTASVQELDARGASNNQEPDPNDPKKSLKKGIISYFLLPGIIPQAKELGRGGFGYLAFLIASVYRAVRILPDSHPYVKPENLGKFGIRQVVAAAANNVKVDKQHIDQIVVFFAVLAAIILLALQFLSFLLLLISGEAWAADASAGAFGGLFHTAHPDKDIAFHMMREVFGIPNMFGSLSGADPGLEGTSDGSTGQTAFHKGLHVMFHFYNLAILLVAVLVFLYYVIVVVAETATTGTPFGKRFSHIYAPLRLVIAIGLLVPLPGEGGTGLNAAQYITLYAAKLGSGFATTGWTEFNKKVDNPLGADKASLIADTKPPDVEGLIGFMATAVTCREAHDKLWNQRISMLCMLKDPNGSEKMLTKTCDEALTIAKSQNVKVVFGQEGPAGITGFLPSCGTLVIQVKAPIESSSSSSGRPGEIHKKYMTFVRQLWEETKLIDQAKCFAGARIPGMPTCTEGAGYTPPISKRVDVSKKYAGELQTLIKTHFDEARSNVDFNMREQVKQLGWGGAGIWYNRIAEVNGAYVVTAMSVPYSEKMPSIMEWVKKKQSEADARKKGCEIYSPNLANGDDVDFRGADKDRALAAILNDVYQYWHCHRNVGTSNVVVDTIQSIFGVNGLMDMRKRVKGVDGKEVFIHPLAKLSAMGSGLVNSAVRNLGFAVGTSFVGGLLGIFSDHIGAGAKALSGLLVSIATIGLGIGFLTFYILPLLPFIYFFFAVGGWVKSIFEAMVGVPLWALAHLRIDGDGIPGRMAVNGYMLIFEIFVRPILTVFGLLGGMAIFTALAMILHEVYSLVVINTAGVDLDKDDNSFFSRNSVDQFFFTCMYAVILYMMAVSSFKMINLVPNMILRWLGQSVQSFNDKAEDPTQGLTQYAAIGGAKIGGQMAGAMTQFASIPGAAGQGLRKGLGGDLQRAIKGIRGT